MKKNFSLLVFVLGMCARTFAQKTYTANEAADKVQADRNVAGDLLDKKSTRAQVEKAVSILRSDLAFLDSMPIKEMAHTSHYLWYRRSDVNRDLASGYALLGEKDSALDALDRMYANGATSRVVRFMENEPTLDAIRNEPRYKALIQKLNATGALWSGQALKTSYKPDLSAAEKAAGLSLLWSQARYNFVHFDHVDIDWNQAYLDWLPKVLETHSTAEYYRVLTRFYAQLKDGHTNVYPPDTLTGDFYSRPPFRTELIEGRVFVNQVFSDSLSRTGIVPGLEVVTIDSKPVIAYAEEQIKPYCSSSTPQDLEIREFAYQLLCGPKDKPIAIGFKDRNGKIMNRSIPRTGYHDVKPRKTLEYQNLGNVGCLTINGFDDDNIVKEFDSLYSEIAKTKGLIIDIRYNGGGSGNIGFDILRRLTDKPFLISASKVLEYESRPGSEPLWEDNGISRFGPNGKIFYDKPVVVLIGPRTFSAAEDFTVAFDFMKRGTLIGMPTGGSTGQPILFSLPGGGTARICAKHDTYPDGKEFVGIGIKPDVMVRPTIPDLLNGIDAAKQKALQILDK